MKLEDAPRELCNKYYDSIRGKTLNVYEWSLLKRFMLDEIKQLDKTFKKVRQKKKTNEHKRSSNTRKGNTKQAFQKSAE